MKSTEQITFISQFVSYTASIWLMKIRTQIHRMQTFHQTEICSAIKIQCSKERILSFGLWNWNVFTPYKPFNGSVFSRKHSPHKYSPTKNVNKRTTSLTWVFCSFYLHSPKTNCWLVSNLSAIKMNLQPCHTCKQLCTHANVRVLA